MNVSDALKEFDLRNVSNQSVQAIVDVVKKMASTIQLKLPTVFPSKDTINEAMGSIKLSQARGDVKDLLFDLFPNIKRLLQKFRTSVQADVLNKTTLSQLFSGIDLSELAKESKDVAELIDDATDLTDPSCLVSYALDDATDEESKLFKFLDKLTFGALSNIRNQDLTFTEKFRLFGSKISDIMKPMNSSILKLAEIWGNRNERII
jgi:hypothetical protein